MTTNLTNYTNMKKEYIMPQVEVVKLEIHHMLAASPPGWNNEVGAPEFDFDGLLDEYEHLK